MLKTIIEFVFDLLIIFLFTLGWNWWHKIPNLWLNSALFTVYLALIFFLYRIIFEWAWSANMKK